MLKMSATAVVLLGLTVISTAAQRPSTYTGAVIRMNTVTCDRVEHPILAALSGAPQASEPAQCREYALVGSNVVYVISTKKNGVLLPLCEPLSFRMLRGVLRVRINDAAEENALDVVSMSLRSAWERDPTNRANACSVENTASANAAPASNSEAAVSDRRARLRTRELPRSNEE